jgi:hypothetical protein
MATTDPFYAATAISGRTGKLSKAQDDFLQSVDGDMTAEQAAQFLELVMGDTDLSENNGLPDPITEVATTTVTPAAAAPELPAAVAAELSADNAQLMAKDGKHVIDFQKLVDAREGEKTWRATAEQAQQELEALKAQAQQRESAGIAPTVADNQLAAASAAIDAGANPDLFGDFSEEAIAAGVKALVSQQVSAEVAKAFAPMQQQNAKTSADAKFDAHLAAIAAAHPDYESLAESKELSDWIDSQPGIARDGYRAALERGTTDQYIELFGTFKSSTGKSQPAPAALSALEAAQAVIAKATHAAPISLSDIPGGRVGASTGDEAMAGMDGAELIAAMSDWPQEKIDRYMNSL